VTEVPLGRDKVAAVLQVQPVGISPVLVNAAPGIGPIIVDLTTEQMADAHQTKGFTEPTDGFLALRFFGDPKTAWPIRFTLDGPGANRMPSLARFIVATSELVGCLTTWAGCTASMPCTISIVQPFGSIRRTLLPPAGSST
jgi:hypothetical protein